MDGMTQAFLVGFNYIEQSTHTEIYVTLNLVDEYNAYSQQGVCHVGNFVLIWNAK